MIYSTTLRRQWYFINYMFPLHIYAVGGAVSFTAIYLTSQAIIGNEQVNITKNLFLGIIANILVLLLLRLYDEIKDVDSDRKLGFAGDPRYKDRPIVNGKISITEIQSLRWLVTALLIFTVSFTDDQVYISFAWLFAYMWLSYKWFFYPKIKNNIVLAFITHNPIALFQAIFLMCFALIDQNTTTIPSIIWWFMLANWLFIATWEVSRKIRLPEEETDYQTYSMVFGWQSATLIAFTLFSSSLLILGYIFYIEHEYWLVIDTMIFIIFAIYAKHCLSLLFSPDITKSKLQNPTENMIGLVNVILIVSILFSYEIKLSLTGSVL